MSRLSVNVFALLATFSIVACITSAPQSIPEQRQQQDGLGAKVTCGAVNFMVTTYLPKAHATSFCNAYLQVPVPQKTQSSPSSTSEEGQSLPTSTRKAYRKAKVPEFNWLRERQSQESTRSTVLERACGCLSEQPKTKTIVQKTTVTTTISSTNTTALPLQPAELELRQASRQLGVASAITINSGVKQSNVSLQSLRATATAEVALRYVSKQLGIASAIAVDKPSNVSMSTGESAGRLGLIRVLQQSAMLI